MITLFLKTLVKLIFDHDKINKHAFKYVCFSHIDIPKYNVKKKKKPFLYDTLFRLDCLTLKFRNIVWNPKIIVSKYLKIP